MNPPKWAGQVHHITCCLLAFSIPFPFLWAQLSVWFVAIAWLLCGQYKTSIRGLISTPGFILFVLYFILHALSYFYSDDKGQSSFDIVSKLSFVLFPLLIGSMGPLPHNRLQQIFLSFCTAIGVTAFICIVKAGFAYSADGDVSHFFYHPLVSGFEANAVYMAWYTLFALGLLLFFPWDAPFRSWKWLRIVMLGIISLFFVLLSSRLLLVLFFLIVLPIYGSRLWKRQILTRAQLLGLLFLFVAGGALLTFTHNPIRQRFADVAHSNVHSAFLPDYHNRPAPDGNLSTRLFIWRAAFDGIRQQNLWLTGCGNGDAHYVINHRIAALGIPNMDDNGPKSNYYNVNLHNMYFQSLLMLGIPGFIVFLLLVLLPFFYNKRIPYRHAFIIFHIAAALFMFQEAALQTQAGVIFYTFFSVIFWRLVKSGSINNSYTIGIT